jgi:diguanylate cyclase (GGDEF)-like protein
VTYYQIMRAIAPNGFWGWITRLPLLLFAMLGLSMAQDVIIDGGFNSGMTAYAQDMILFGIPVAVVILSMATHLRAAQQRVEVVRDADPLTGLLNRRAFTTRLARALPQSGVLIVFDVDGLKSTNIRHGHHCGDLVLMALAQRCREVTRASDILGRLDGATFALYLPGATEVGACVVADRLRSSIQITTHGRALLATICVGAVLANGCTPQNVLLRAAELALEEAKLRGQDHVKVNQWPRVA